MKPEDLVGCECGNCLPKCLRTYGESEYQRGLEAAAALADAARDRLARSELSGGAKIAAVAAMTAFASKLRATSGTPK